MRWLGIATGGVLIGVAVGLFFLYSQTEVERLLGRGEWVHVLVVGVNDRLPEQPAEVFGLVSLSPQDRAVWLGIPAALSLPQPDGDSRTLMELYGELPLAAFLAQLARVVDLSLPYWVEIPLSQIARGISSLDTEVVLIERFQYVDQARGIFVDIPAGVQRLDEAKAFAYLRYLHPEDEQARLERLANLWQAFWSRVSELDWKKWREATEDVFKPDNTNLGRWDLLALAQRFHHLSLQNWSFASLPVGLEGGELRPLVVETRRLVTSLYQGKDYLTRREVRVVVLNGAGVPFLARRTRAWLIERGFTVVGVGDTELQEARTALVLVRVGAEAQGRMVAQLLPGGAEVMAAQDYGVDRLGGWPPEADVVLILGVGFEI
ncbi:MAG TPA: LytR family transcriptional regulator [Candidatus Acetothermia bacterium]|nr:LytR family transcriptional regulator [Candidatus Acetothermia bacterium]